MSILLNASGESLSRTTNLPSITSFTMMGWFYWLTDTNAYQNYLMIGPNGGSPYYAMQQRPENNLIYVWNGTTSSDGSTRVTGDWRHLALTCAGTGAGQLLGYENGALTMTAAGNASVTSALIMFGNDNDGDFLTGSVAAIKIYGAVLSEAEIAAEMPYWEPQRLTNLNSYFPCNDNGTLANNYVDANGGGAGFNLTANGTLSIDTAYPTITAGPGGATWEQLHYRWRHDNGSETTATWAAAEDTAP